MMTHPARPRRPLPGEVVRYDDWFAALGNPIPEANRAALADLLDDWNYPYRQVRATVEATARGIEADDPTAVYEALRSLLGSDETGVIRCCATICCPPLREEQLEDLS